MESIEIEFEIQCAECGAALKVVNIKRQSKPYQGSPPYWVVIVKPCQNCMDNAAKDAD